MSTDISLLLERREADQWTLPMDVASRLEDPSSHLGIVEVCSWSTAWEVTELLFGDRALFPMRPGFAPDMCASVEKYVRANLTPSDPFAGWIMLADLELWNWQTRRAYLRGSVPAEVARLFGDGGQPAPVAALKRAGFADPVVEVAVEGKISVANAPLDLDEVHLKQDNQKVDVTWTETLADFCGIVWDSGLSRIANLEDVEHYRLVTAIG